MALHKHQCGDCRHIFEHEVPDTSGMPEAEAVKAYDDGHMCPECHTGPWKDRYYAAGEGPPTDMLETILLLIALSEFITDKDRRRLLN